MQTVLTDVRIVRIVRRLNTQTATTLYIGSTTRHLKAQTLDIICFPYQCGVFGVACSRTCEHVITCQVNGYNFICGTKEALNSNYSFNNKKNVRSLPYGAYGPNAAN